MYGNNGGDEEDCDGNTLECNKPCIVRAFSIFFLIFGFYWSGVVVLYV